MSAFCIFFKIVTLCILIWFHNFLLISLNICTYLMFLGASSLQSCHIVFKCGKNYRDSIPHNSNTLACNCRSIANHIHHQHFNTSILLSLVDDILSDLLWAFPQLLPLTRGASFTGQQGELVLQALQILSRVWPSKQKHKGMFLFLMHNLLIIYSILL